MIIVRVGFATDKRITDLEGSTRYRPAGLKFAQRTDTTRRSSRMRSGIEVDSDGKPMSIELMHYVDDADVDSVRGQDERSAADKESM